MFISNAKLFRLRSGMMKLQIENEFNLNQRVNLIPKHREVEELKNKKKIEIPPVLKNFKFIRLHPESKIPVAMNWMKKGLPYDHPALQIWLSLGGNYGVLASKEYFIIDADNLKIAKVIEERLPETFTVLSGSGNGKHFYFKGYCSKNYKFHDPLLAKDRRLQRILNRWMTAFRKKEKKEELSEEEKERKTKVEKFIKSWGEVQVKGKFVVGPNSIHPETKNEYKIIKNVPIAEITEGMILDVFKKYIKNKIEKHRIKKIKRKIIHSENDVFIPIDQVIDLSLLKQRSKSEYQGAHPVHGSTTGMNFSVNIDKNTWYCHRCQSGGSSLSFIAVEEGFLDCSDCVPGALRGETFKKVLKIARERGLLPKEKEKNEETVKEKNDKNDIRFIARKNGYPPCYRACFKKYLDVHKRDKKEIFNFIKQSTKENFCKKMKQSRVCIQEW